MRTRRRDRTHGVAEGGVVSRQRERPGRLRTAWLLLAAVCLFLPGPPARAGESPPRYLTSFGGIGEGPGEFLTMLSGIGVAPADGTVFVAEDFFHVQRFTALGSYLSGFARADELATCLAVAPDNTVYVAGQSMAGGTQQTIHVYALDGTELGSIGHAGTGDGEFQQVGGVAVAGDGTVYVADTGNNRVQKFAADGTFLAAWGTKGIGEGQFDAPAGVAVAGDGVVYVLDTGNYRVQTFSATGAFVAQWGSIGDGEGQFDLPNGIAVAGDGSVYVADSGNNRIQKFTAAGVFVTAWGSEGEAVGEFSHPMSVAVSPGGDIYVADSFNYRVQVFSYTSRPIALPPFTLILE